MEENWYPRCILISIVVGFLIKKEEFRILNEIFQTAMDRNRRKYIDDPDAGHVSGSILNAISHNFYKLMKGESPPIPLEQCYFWQTWNNTKRPFVSVDDLVVSVPNEKLIEAIETHTLPVKMDFRAIFDL